MDSGVTYGRDYTNQVYSKYSNKYYDPYAGSISGAKADGGSYLDFDQYLQLLVAQMQNQDFNDPMSDSEVLAQMAQYSMLEGIKNMTQQSNISYTMSLVGKVVTVNTGNGYITGKVDSVTISNGEAAIIIGGRAFSSGSVSDIVDDDAYNKLRELIGKTVKTNTVNAEDSIKGKVQDVLFLYGDGYVVINGTVYPAKYVSVVEDDEDGEVPEVGEGGEEGDVPETDGDEGDVIPEVGSGNGDSEDEGTDTENIAVTNGYVVDKSQSYHARSQSLVDILMKELDKVGKTSETSAAAETDKSDDQYYLQTAYVQTQDYHAALIGDEELRELGMVVAYPVSSASYSVPASNEVYSGNSETVYTSNITETTYGNGTNRVNYTANSASGLTYKGVTTEASVSTSDCVPHRISVEKYPAEAALADAYGTRMYDIRFIHNTGITSRILTDRVIGYTSSGKEVTEIGYSGVGQLGEVVTFKDGTQRVEILLKNGHSGWLTTSGNYTLDEICVRIKDSEPGSLAGKLTPEELAIRHYSNPFEGMDLSGVGLSFKNQLTSQGSV